MSKKSLPVAVIGGGPVGLAAAAHLLEHDESFILFEKGEKAGANFIDYGEVRLFSPWQYNLDPAMVRMLKRTDWQEPKGTGLPTGKDVVHQYLDPFAALPQIAPSLYFNAEVKQVSRKGMDKRKSTGRKDQLFVLHVNVAGETRKFEAKAVVDASGVWNHPNPLASDGLWTEEETAAAPAIYYNIPDIAGEDRAHFEKKHVVVVGSGHSAINSLLQLNKLRKKDAAEAPAKITWINRKKTVAEAYAKVNDKVIARYKLSEQLEELVDSGALDIWHPFYIEKVFLDPQKKVAITGTINGESKTIEQADVVIANTGNRPDIDLFRELRYEMHPILECAQSLYGTIKKRKGVVPTHGVNELRHEEKDFYIIGAKSFGRSPSFFLINGYEQARSVAASIAGNQQEAEERVISFPEAWFR